MINLYEIVKQQPGYFKQLSYKDLLVTQYDCPQIERKESFLNEQYYIAYIISGRRTFCRNEQSWDLSEGKAVFVKQGAHIAVKEAGEGWCVMIFFLPTDYLVNFIKHNRASLPASEKDIANKDYVVTLNVTDTSRAFFYSMLPYFTQDPLPNNELVDLKFREMLFNVLSDPANGILLSYLLQQGLEQNPLSVIMENNCLFNLSLEQYAKLCHQSLATFQREFRKIYHQTPAKWLKEKRLTHAAEKIRSCKDRIQDIAYESGFENFTHFSRSFKEAYGVTPLSYREKTTA